MKKFSYNSYEKIPRIKLEPDVWLNKYLEILMDSWDEI